MRKRIVIALLVLFAVVIAVFVLPEVFSNEPKYQGKTAKGWFMNFVSTGQNVSFGPENEAIQALRHLDTNTIVFLVNEYYSTNRDSSLRSNVQAFFAKIPLLHVPKYISAEERSGAAGELLIYLAPTNNFFFSLVTNHLYAANTSERIQTIYLLASVGLGANEMMPMLRQMLQSTNIDDRELASYALLKLGKAAQLAVPELVPLVIYEVGVPRSSYESTTAFKVLSQLKSSASNALPVLKAELARTTETYQRLRLAELICQIDLRDTNAFLMVLRAAKDPTNKFRNEALSGLERIGMYPSPVTRAGPMLISGVAGQGINLVSLTPTGDTNQALVKIQLPPNRFNQVERLDAAIAILQLHSAHEAASSCLVTALRDKEWGGLALAKLAWLSRLPLPVKSVLQEFASDPNHPLSLRAALILQEDREQQGAVR